MKAISNWTIREAFRFTNKEDNPIRKKQGLSAKEKIRRKKTDHFMLKGMDAPSLKAVKEAVRRIENNPRKASRDELQSLAEFFQAR